ncbi:MAG TPA: hypothetical protein DCL41_03650, partial [Bdellovibrionales bacterium]|nr:hypothetical protein [Bdellovibrionales bacterium]
MKSNKIVESLQENCSLFGNSVSEQIKRFLDAELLEEKQDQPVGRLETEHDLYFSLLFSGSVYGEFIIAMNRETAMQLVEPGSTPDQFENLKRDIFDAFKEILNISAGKTLKSLDKDFQQLTITAPKVTEGRLHLPDFPLYCRRYSHNNQKICFYLYVDQMALNIAQSFERQRKEIQISKKALMEQDIRSEQLKRLNQAKTEFLANMSHELRTPLNGMIGTLEMIKQTELTEIQKSQIDLVEQSGDFLLGIINDILEFSRIEAGKLQVESRDFNLWESIEKTAKVISSQVYRKNLDFIVEIDPDVPKNVVGDETRLKQILINLIGNSIKFTPTGHILLKVKSQRNGMVSISVEDTGVGIPPTRLKTIFESFSQADVSDNRKYGGSGLGLTICKALVEAMDGKITVSSVEAKGTTFTFTIPTKAKLSVVENVDVKEVPPVMGWSSNPVLLDNMKFNFKKLHAKKMKFESDSTLKNLPKGDKNWCFVDWRNWTNLTDEDRNEWTTYFQNPEHQLFLLVTPTEVLEMEKYKDQIKGLYGQAIVLPLVTTDLIKAFDNKEPYSFESKPKANLSISIEKQEGAPILLVEDNPVNQQVGRALLESLGFAVEIAGNGEEAIAKYSPGKFSIILMDCQIPVLNGFDASVKIREMEQEAGLRTPIIALTASAF